MDALEQITGEMLSADQRQVADAIGMEAFRALVRDFGGSNIYIPKADYCLRGARNAEIRAKFTGYNYRELAREYNLTENAIRQIVADLDRQMRAEPLEGQLSL